MKRVNIFCGHYGSGKTNIAINYAVYLKNQGLDVSIADIDIVNPYFRTKDSEDELNKKGIEVISLPFANTNVDLPALPAEVYSLVQNKSRYAVFDVGGDDRGAYALGRYVPSILEENNYNMFFVANFYRPLTQTAEEALEVIREIESACAIPFTGIINNSNLGEETAAEDIFRTVKEAEKLSRLSGLPLEMTTCDESIDLDNTFKLKLQKKIF
ncbi:MAG: hypothetical protein ACI4F5_08160 [Acutalibacteraceae bacterium]